MHFRRIKPSAVFGVNKPSGLPVYYESWVMTERMQSQMQASEIRFLRRIEGVTLFNKVRSFEIWKSLDIEPLLLRIERSQLRRFGYVSRMPQETLPKQALLAKANGEKKAGRLRTTKDESILHWETWVELLGASPKQNHWCDRRPWNVAA